MFTALVQKAKDRTICLEKLLDLYSQSGEALRDTDTRVLRHSAIMTQLYNIYESFSESVLNLWLSRLPRHNLFPNLPEEFRNAYRSGIARLIKDIGKRNYRHLVLADILTSYRDALEGNPNWGLINDALTLHDVNLRRAEFERLFNSVGLNGIWHALEASSHITVDLADADLQESLEQRILNLVNFRNDAAHGTPDEILGSDALREWVEFTRAFCNALADAVTHRIVYAEAEHNVMSVLGTVTETLSNNILIARCHQGPLKVGDTIYFLRERDCTRALIESLQINDMDTKEVCIDEASIQVGIKTSAKAHRNARLVRIDL